VSPRLSIREVYDELSLRYEMRWRKYIRRSVHETLVRANIHSGDRVLDIGCGTGALLRELAGASVRAIGADVSIGMLASARFCGASLAAGDAELLPFRSETFDSDHIQLILISGRTGNAAWRRSEESCAAAVNWSSPTGATTSSPAASATHTCECAAPHINES